MTRRAILFCTVAVAVMSVGCSGAQRPAARPVASVARDWIPLRTGAAWSYDTETGLGTGAVLNVLAVVRADGDRFQVRSGNRTETWEYRPEGVWREGEFVLRDPVRTGTTWEGRNGGRYEIRATGLRRTVGDQRFAHVVEVQRANPETRIVTTTWFAPFVGVIEIQASTVSSLGTSTSIRSTLRGFTLGEDEATQ